jgi:pimeloyl-ACP methyl ester carboxylesterase
MVGCPAVRAVAIGLLAALACAVPAAAAQTTTAVAGAPGPGPSRYDKVFVTKFGSASAKRVLILMPGFQGGAGDFTLDAREIVKRVPGLQVWALDRRTQPLEDTSRFDDALAGRITIKQAFDYYLGWLSDPSIQPHFQPIDQSKFGFAKQWGLSLTLQDVRRVVLRAKREGKRVILGGHSLGASLTVAYASWDFNGRPGYKDLDGLVLIDGGLLGSFSTPDLAATKKAITALDTNGPFVDLLGLKLPWAAGVFSEMAAVAALKEPTAPSLAQTFPLLPAVFKPPVPVTNRGQLGFAFDASTSPKSLSLIHVRAGNLGPNGDWVNGEVTPIERLAQTFAQEPNAAEWYFPAKLTIDVDAANALTRDKQTDYLRLRPWHRRDVNLPLYALQTDLSNGRVLRGAKRFIAGSKVPRSRSVLVDASATESHLDPLTAAPDRNRFLQTVVPFLRAVR